MISDYRDGWMNPQEAIRVLRSSLIGLVGESEPDALRRLRDTIASSPVADTPCNVDFLAAIDALIATGELA